MSRILPLALVLAFAASAGARDIVATNASVKADIIWHVNDLPGGGIEITGADPKPILSLAVPDAFSSEDETFPVKRIAANAFANCVGLTSVTLPSTLESIGDFAFSNCSSLVEISIPYGVREIGKRPFVNTILRKLVLPDSLQVIDGNPVAGCTLISAIEVSDEQPFFATEDGLLYDKRKTTLLACPATKAEIALPDSVTTIAEDAFYGCNLLVGGEEQVGDAVWSYELADGQAQVTTVVGATNVVTVPAKLGGHPVAGIAPDAFNGCSGITAFAVEPGSTAFATRNGALYSADGKTLVRVPDTFKLPVTVTTTETEVTISETIIPRINSSDGTDATERTVSEGTPRTTTSTQTIAPTVPPETLFDGIARIEDFAFFGCGKVESSATVSTNEVSSMTGFIGDTVYVKTTSIVKTLAVVPTCAICLPASIAFSDASFVNSGITAVTQDRQPGASTRIVSRPVSDRTAPQAGDLAPQTAYLGWLTKDGVIAGSLTLKTGRLSKDVLKASGSYQLIGQKKVSVRSVDALVPAGYGCILAKDIAKTGAFNAFKGKVWTMALSTLDNGGYPLMNGFSTFTATVSAKGKVKVTGYLADGTKVSASTAMVSVDGKIRIPVVAQLYAGKKGGFALVMDVDAQGEVTVSELSELICFAADKTSRTVRLDVVAAGSPARAFDGTIGFDEGGLPSDVSVDFQNLGWMPHYTKKSGLVKGSVAARQGSRRVKAAIWGVMIGEQGFGTGIVKKTGSWEVFLR